MNKLGHLYKVHYYVIILLLVGGCSNLSAIFSEHAYQQDVTLKVESLRLMKQATEPYSNHVKEVRLLKKNYRLHINMRWEGRIIKRRPICGKY